VVDRFDGGRITSNAEVLLGAIAQRIQMTPHRVWSVTADGNRLLIGNLEDLRRAITWCEANGVDYLFCLAKNSPMVAQIEVELAW
jgi:hypothetical protein